MKKTLELDNKKLKRHDKWWLPLINILPKWVTPNMVSAFRIIPLSIVLLLTYNHLFILAGLLFIAASFLDSLDGSLARIRGAKTDQGALFDPIIDKYISIGLFCFYFTYIESEYYKILLLATILIEILLLSASIFKFIFKNFNWLELKQFGANQYGKIKMVCQITTLSILLLFLSSGTFISLPVLPLTFSLFLFCLSMSTLSLYGHLQEISIKSKNPA